MDIKQKFKALKTPSEKVLTFDPICKKFGIDVAFTFKIKAASGYRTTIEMNVQEAKQLHKFLDDTIKEENL